MDAEQIRGPSPRGLHMQCQRRILNIRWFNHVRNADVTLRTGVASIESRISPYASAHQVTLRTGLTSIESRIRRMCHSLFGHVVRLNPDAPAHQVLALQRDISMARRIPTGWRRPRGRPRTTWLDHIKADTGLPIATTWTRATDRTRWRRDATATLGYAVQ